MNANSTSLEKSLIRRKRLSELFENAFEQSPQEMDDLLTAVSKAYYSGSIPRFWDVLAGLAGSDRGWGNGSFFTAIEIQKKIKEVRP